MMTMRILPPVRIMLAGLALVFSSIIYADTTTTIEISPSVVALKISPVIYAATTTPTLSFQFHKSETTRTLHVNCDWYPLGYPSYETPHGIRQSVAPGIGAVSFEVPEMSRFGLYQVVAALTAEDLRGIAESYYGRGMVAVIPDNAQPIDCENSPFGMGTNFSQMPPSPRRDALIKYASMVGVRWAREELLHTDNVNAHREVLRQMSDNGLSLCGALNAREILQPFATSALSKVATERFLNDVTLFADMIHATGETGSLRNWELAGFSESLNNLSPTLYAELFLQVRQCLDNDALLLPDGGTTWTTEFFDKLLSKDVRIQSSPIAYNHHFSAHAVNPNAFWSATSGKQEHAKQFGFAGDSYLTEVGWPSNFASSWQERQADFLVQTYVTALSKGFKRVFWERFACEESSSAAMSYGLIEPDTLDPRSGFVAYAAMVQLLERTKHVHSELLGIGIHAHYFQDVYDQTYIAVIWSDTDAGVLIPSANNPTTDDLIFFDQFGNPTPFMDWSHGVLTISRTPIYIQSNTLNLPQVLSTWKLHGFPKLKVAMDLPPAFPAGTTFTVALQNTTRHPISGKILFEGTELLLECADTVSISPLSSQTLTASVVRFEPNAANAYPVVISLLQEDADTPYLIIKTDLAERIIRRGAPAAHTPLGILDGAIPVTRILEQNATDIIPCVNWVSSATLYMLYDDENLYLSMLVDDRSFVQYSVEAQLEDNMLVLGVQPCDARTGNVVADYLFRLPEVFGTLERTTTADGLHVSSLQPVTSPHAPRSYRIAITIPRTSIPAFRGEPGELVQFLIESKLDFEAAVVTDSQPEEEVPHNLRHFPFVVGN